MIIARTLAATATAIGLLAWVVFFRAGLVLSHYDAKAHLVVARRVIDNITPGWQQFGAVWLPLPHLIQFLPTQIDVLYRTGAFASLVSIASFGLTAYAAARLVLAVSGLGPRAASRWAASLGWARWQPQGPGQLGLRMQRQFARAWREGAEQVVLIGSDLPELITKQQ